MTVALTVRSAPLFAPAAFFAVVQFYTSLASLAPTPPVGYVLANRAVALGMVVTLAVAALTCAWLLWRDGLWTRSHVVEPWLIVTALASLLGFSPGAGLQVLAIMLLGVCFHTAFVALGGRRAVRLGVLATYGVAGAAACAAAVAMHLRRVPAELFALNNGRAAGPFVTANQLAAFAVLYACVSAGLASSTRGSLRVLGVTGMLLALAALYFSFSLGGWLALAAAALFAALAYRRRAATLAAIAALVFLAAFASLALAHHDPSQQFVRVASWIAGARAFELFPLSGSGPMTFWLLYPAIAPAGGDPPGNFGALHPHNVVLSIAGELGLIGLAGVAAGWVAFARQIRAALAQADAPRRRLTVAVCAALVASAVQGAVDLVGVVTLAFVWVPYTALALVAARYGPP